MAHDADAAATFVQVGPDGSTLTATVAPAEDDGPSLDFLKGAGRLLGNFPQLRASLFTALCVMAQARGSAFVEIATQKQEQQLEKVLKTLQGRFAGRLAYDLVEGEEEDGRGGMLMWSPQHPRIADALLASGVPDAESAGTASSSSPPPPWLLPERPDEELVQTLFVRGMFCPPNGTESTQTLTKYRRVAQRVGLEVHCEVEYETQQGNFDEGDKVERHITNTVTLRGQEGPV